jgi:exopolyphosphatase/guanosine-5'-triphosphate,3'-diphosphate pyrophosphatase
MNNQDNNDNSRIVAAIDLGSNSFHMIVARLDESNTLSVIDKLRETVRLGGGLKDNGKLSKESMETALACLEQFGQRIRGLPKSDVRIAGTNTLRVARNAEKFLIVAWASYRGHLGPGGSATDLSRCCPRQSGANR